MTERRLLTSITQSTTYRIELLSEEIDKICAFDKQVISTNALKTILAKNTPAQSIHYEQGVTQINFKLAKGCDTVENHVRIQELINKRLDTIDNFV